MDKNYNLSFKKAILFCHFFIKNVLYNIYFNEMVASAHGSKLPPGPLGLY